MSMLVQFKSIPYNPVGYGYIRAALSYQHQDAVPPLAADAELVANL